MSFTFDGITSDDKSILVESYPVWVIPNRIYNEVNVPGRNGTLLFDTGSYENVPQPYDIAIISRDGKFEDKVHSFLSWINGNAGYRRLEDSKTPDTYRMARFKGNAAEIENAFNMIGKATITFDCMPFRWLKSGETSITISSTNTDIVNPTKFPSKPLIKVNGTSAGTITIGDVTMKINTLTDYLNIDCYEQNIYRLNSENMNNCVELGEFCEIPADKSKIYFTGGITSLEIVPRWMTQ